MLVLGAFGLMRTPASAAVGGCGGGEDYNGDGFADLAVGVPDEDIGGVASAGAIHVIYGGPGGLSAAGDQVFHQDSDGMNDTAENSDFFGDALGSGDFDGYGFDDLAIGVSGEETGFGFGNQGEVQIVYGTATGLTSSGDQVFHQDTPRCRGR